MRTSFTRLALPSSAALTGIAASLCLQESNKSFSSAPTREKFDLVVIGGGSGGLACAKRAAGNIYITYIFTRISLVLIDKIICCVIYKRIWS